MKARRFKKEYLESHSKLNTLLNSEGRQKKPRKTELSLFEDLKGLVS